MSEETEASGSATQLLPTRRTRTVEPVDDKWELWTGGTRLRGVDLHPCRLFAADECLEPIALEDVQDLASLGANLINASYPGAYTERPPYEIDEAALTYLDDLIAWAEEVGIFVVIQFRTGPGRNEGAITGVIEPLNDIWLDQAAQDAWIDMWRFTAERYKDSPAVAAFNLMAEPHPNSLIDPDGELEPLAVQAELQGALADWNRLAAAITAVIREVDTQTPIIINSINWASAAWFSILEPTGDSRTVYSLHAYDPDVYTGQDVGEDDIRYPDLVDDAGERISFDREWLDQNYRPVLDFAETYGVPIYVGEFGALRWVPNAREFLLDQTDLFEQYGWNYAVYVWRGDEPEFDGFNLELGADPNNHAADHTNALLALFRDRWAQNTVFPGISPDSGARPALEEVRNWLYLIDVNLDPEMVDRIAASSHDMVVLDFIPSEENNTNYPMAEVVDQLHTSSHPKMVIAYIDIGQAESYRNYWQPGWGIGDPIWIAGGDPDGWEGNFPVAFWHDEWRDIWLGGGGLLEAIVDAGFDGVYLDWVEAYSDDNVLRIADADGVDARQEMIWWVSDIADFGRSIDPEFLVISQNAAELAESDDYLEAIDAIAQEQVWFDGGADNEPPGDCPLPRTESDLDTEAYVQSLSHACRRQYEDFPESTLHVTSESYLKDLGLAQDKGTLIFTVDYALDPENIAWVYDTSRELGFIPFVGNRALDQYVEPFQ